MSVSGKALLTRSATQVQLVSKTVNMHKINISDYCLLLRIKYSELLMYYKEIVFIGQGKGVNE